MWHAKTEKCILYRIFVGNPEGKRPLGRPTRKWEHNTRKDIKQIERLDMDFFLLITCFILVSIVQRSEHKRDTYLQVCAIQWKWYTAWILEVAWVIIALFWSTCPSWSLKNHVLRIPTHISNLHGAYPSGRGQRPVGGFYEHGTETSDFIKCSRFLYWLRRGHGSAIQTAFVWVVAPCNRNRRFGRTCYHLLPTRLHSLIIMKATSYFISTVCFQILFQNHTHRPWIPRSLKFRGNRGSFPGVKRPGREVVHSPPFNFEVKNEQSYTSTPPACLYGMDRDSFTVPLPLIQSVPGGICQTSGDCSLS